MELELLPEGWEMVSLGEVCMPRRGKTAPQSLPGVAFIGLENVESETGRIIGQGVTDDVRSSVGTFQAGDVLYGRLRPYLNKVARPEFSGTASAEFIVFPGCDEIIDPEFLHMVLMSPDFVEFTGNLDQGDRPRVKWEQISRFQFGLPPFNEQKRIATLFWSTHAQCAGIEAQLKRSRALGDLLNQRLPANIFCGELDGRFRGGQAPELPPYELAARFQNLGSIGDGWRWAEMKSLATITGGITKNPNRSALPIQAPYLRVANVYANELRLQDVAVIRVSEREFERTVLVSGDLLVVEGNGSVEQIGRVAEWDGSISPCLHQNHLIRVRANDGVPGRYLLRWLMSPGGRSALETVASSSAGLHTLSISKVGAIPVPVPPGNMMEEIAAVLDEADARIRSLSLEAHRIKNLLKVLRRRLWRKALEGNLVAQDAQDEPARVLLESRRARCVPPKAS